MNWIFLSPPLLVAGVLLLEPFSLCCSELPAGIPPSVLRSLQVLLYEEVRTALDPQTAPPKPAAPAPAATPAPVSAPERFTVQSDGHPLAVWGRRPAGTATVRGAILLVHGRTWSSRP
ncbi:MAG TPA: hypothetical protein VF424_17235, partial [Vicinamibacterales bacterium]